MIRMLPDKARSEEEPSSLPLSDELPIIFSRLNSSEGLQLVEIEKKKPYKTKSRSGTAPQPVIVEKPDAAPLVVQPLEATPPSVPVPEVKKVEHEAAETPPVGEGRAVKRYYRTFTRSNRAPKKAVASPPETPAQDIGESRPELAARQDVTPAPVPAARKDHPAKPKPTPVRGGRLRKEILSEREIIRAEMLPEDDEWDEWDDALSLLDSQDVPEENMLEYTPRIGMRELAYIMGLSTPGRARYLCRRLKIPLFKDSAKSYMVVLRIGKIILNHPKNSKVYLEHIKKSAQDIWAEMVEYFHCDDEEQLTEFAEGIAYGINKVNKKQSRRSETGETYYAPPKQERVTGRFREALSADGGKTADYALEQLRNETGLAFNCTDLAALGKRLYAEDVHISGGTRIPDGLLEAALSEFRDMREEDLELWRLKGGIVKESDGPHLYVMLEPGRWMRDDYRNAPTNVESIYNRLLKKHGMDKSGHKAGTI